jgi:hypothetical protein
MIAAVSTRRRVKFKLAVRIRDASGQIFVPGNQTSTPATPATPLVFGG